METITESQPQPQPQIKYKLVNQQLTTFNGCQWKIGIPKETSGEGDLCSSGWLHYYHDPLLAVLLNPIHADIHNPRLFTCLVEGGQKDDRGLKGGCTKLTLIEEIPLPVVTKNQKIAFGILCAQQVYSDNGGVWDNWAEKWLSGEDRSEKSRVDAADADAAYAAAAAYASYAAANAAAYASYAANAANAAAYAAYAAADAAYAAAAAYAASEKNSPFPFSAILAKVLTVQ